MTSMRYPLMKNSEGLLVVKKSLNTWAPLAAALVILVVFFLGDVPLYTLMAGTCTLAMVSMVYLVRFWFVDIPHEWIYMRQAATVAGAKKYVFHQNGEECPYDEVTMLFRYQIVAEDDRTILQVTKEAPIRPLKVLKESDPERRPFLRKDDMVRLSQISHKLVNPEFEDGFEILVLPGFPKSGVERRYIRTCLIGDCVIVSFVIAGAIETTAGAMMIWMMAFRAATGTVMGWLVFVFALLVTGCVSTKFWMWLMSKECYDSNQSLELLRNPTQGVEVVSLGNEGHDV